MKYIIKQVEGKQGTWALCKIAKVSDKNPQGLVPLMIDTTGTEFLEKVCKAEKWPYTIDHETYVNTK